LHRRAAQPADFLRPGDAGIAFLGLLRLPGLGGFQRGLVVLAERIGIVARGFQLRVGVEPGARFGA
jgi:hypothetical protein